MTVERTIPLEIAQQIAEYVYADCLKIKAKKEEEELYGRFPYFLVNEFPWNRWDTTLLKLRQTTKAFQAAVDRLLFKDLILDKISVRSFTKFNKVLSSVFIRSAVTVYHFNPNVCLLRPIVASNHWGYYEELAAGRCGHSSEPRYSELKAEHEMRQRVAKHYDEQLYYMGPNLQGLPWIWSRLKRALRGAKPEPFTSQLRTLPCFTQIHRLENLKKLRLGYSKPRSYQNQDTWVHYVVKNDISAGLITILKNAPIHLSSITLDSPTLTDLENIVFFARKESTNASTIYTLNVQLSEESFSHKKAKNGWQDTLHTHASGGTSLAEFLSLFENLQYLKLSYGDERDVGTRLVLPHFHPQALRHLRRISLLQLVLNAEDLQKLILGDSVAPTLDLKEWDIKHVALFSDGPTWTAVLDACSKRWPNINRRTYSLIKRNLGYLDMSKCSKRDLERMGDDFDANLQHTQGEDLTGTHPLYW